MRVIVRLALGLMSCAIAACATQPVVHPKTSAADFTFQPGIAYVVAEVTDPSLKSLPGVNVFCRVRGGNQTVFRLRGYVFECEGPLEIAVDAGGGFGGPTANVGNDRRIELPDGRQVYVTTVGSATAMVGPNSGAFENQSVPVAQAIVGYRLFTPGEFSPPSLRLDSHPVIQLQAGRIHNLGRVRGIGFEPMPASDFEAIMAQFPNIDPSRVNSAPHIVTKATCVEDGSIVVGLYYRCIYPKPIGP